MSQCAVLSTMSVKTRLTVPSGHGEVDEVFESDCPVTNATG